MFVLFWLLPTALAQDCEVNQILHYDWLGWSEKYQQYAVSTRASDCTPNNTAWEVELIDVYRADGSHKRAFLKEVLKGKLEDYTSQGGAASEHTGELLDNEKIQAHLIEGQFNVGTSIDLGSIFADPGPTIGPCSIDVEGEKYAIVGADGKKEPLPIDVDAINRPYALHWGHGADFALVFGRTAFMSISIAWQHYLKLKDFPVLAACLADTTAPAEPAMEPIKEPVAAKPVASEPATTPLVEAPKGSCGCRSTSSVGAGGAFAMLLALIHRRRKSLPKSGTGASRNARTPGASPRES